METSSIEVSVIIPVYNEEKHIEKCIQSILKQTYPMDDMEVIFVDGSSTDRTREILQQHIRENPHKIRLLDNPKQTVPYAMNIGIRNSTGKYIIRMDAHSEYPDDYISKCVLILDELGVDNVGGLAIAKGSGSVGNAFAKVLSSRFGVGNSSFRTNADSGYVDTVPFGAFRREVFSRYGLYDERLTRNQDYELNYRIRKHGGRIYLDSTIHLIYYCRDTLPGILRQSYENGKWNVITWKLCPGSMSLRHFVPLLFIVALVSLPMLSLVEPLFMWPFVGVLGIYGLIDLLEAASLATNAMQFFLLIALFPLFHISYGCGSLAGLAFVMLMRGVSTVD